MSNIAIHDAFQFNGAPQPSIKRQKNKINPSQQELKSTPVHLHQNQNDQESGPVEIDTGRYPSDASNSNYPVKIRCHKCRAVSITRMSSELGPAAWVWCVLLAPFACMGISCLCIQSCRDKVHFCNRCGVIVGKKPADVC